MIGYRWGVSKNGAIVASFFNYSQPTAAEMSAQLAAWQPGASIWGPIEADDSDAGNLGSGISGGGGDGYYGNGYNQAVLTEREQQTFDHLKELAEYNRDTVNQNFENQKKIYDIAEQSARNLSEKQYCDAAQKANNEWYAQHQKMQSVAAFLKDKAGNALTGSGLYDFLDMIALKDDIDDVAVLTQFIENIETIYNELFSTLSSINNSRNDAARETWEALRSIIADFAAQSNNINPKLYKAPGVDDWPFANPTTFDDNLKQALTTIQFGLVRPDLATDILAAIAQRSIYDIDMSSNREYNQALINDYKKAR